jgi:hypothetical protein
MGTLLCSDRAAYVSRTPAGRACTSARLAGSMLLDVVDVVGAQQRARGQEQPHSPASKNSQRAAACASREASRSTRHSMSCLGKAHMYIPGRLAYRTCFLSVLGPLARRAGTNLFPRTNPGHVLIEAAHRQNLGLYFSPIRLQYQTSEKATVVVAGSIAGVYCCRRFCCCRRHARKHSQRCCNFCI